MEERGTHTLVEEGHPDREEEPDEDGDGGFVRWEQEDEQRGENVADGD